MKKMLSLLMIGALALTFAFAQRTTAAKSYSLTLQVTPANAQVFVDNAPVGGNPAVLVAGKHVVRATAAGYVDFTTTVSLASDTTLPIALAAVPAPAVSTAPFLAGKTLAWETNAAGGQNGTIKVVSVAGAKFNLEQVNVKNAGAGVTKLDGEFKNGQVFIYNRQWGETWTGSVSNGTVSGTINGSYSFKIYEATAAAAPAVSTAPFLAGKTLRWETNAAGGQNGTIKVVSADGAKFNIEQVNVKNAAAGVTKMDGEVKNGQFFIYNRQWGETWVGTLSGGAVTGTINNSYTFRIFE